jgi:hypothetical protein
MRVIAAAFLALVMASGRASAQCVGREKSAAGVIIGTGPGGASYGACGELRVAPTSYAGLTVASRAVDRLRSAGFSLTRHLSARESITAGVNYSRLARSVNPIGPVKRSAIAFSGTAGYSPWDMKAGSAEIRMDLAVTLLCAIQSDVGNDFHAHSNWIDGFGLVKMEYGRNNWQGSVGVKTDTPAGYSGSRYTFAVSRTIRR